MKLHEFLIVFEHVLFDRVVHNFLDVSLVKEFLVLKSGLFI